MQSKCVSWSCASASSLDPTAVTATSSPEPTSSTIELRWSSSSSTTSRLFTPRLMNVEICWNVSSRCSLSSGFWMKATAPARSAFVLPSASPAETTCTGMWRVAGWCLRWSSTVQPSITGRFMSSTIASGLNSCASASPASPRRATRPLKLCSRAASSTVRANVASSSTISTTRSPAITSSRSSGTSLGRSNVESRSSSGIFSSASRSSITVPSARSDSPSRTSWSSRASSPSTPASPCSAGVNVDGM